MKKVNGVGVEIKNLSLNLGGNKILDNISINVEPGTIHCIIGPNGGGKSSLIKCLLSLVSYEGEIYLKYEDEKVIGYVPQSIEYDKTLPITVEDFLTMIYQKKPCFFRKDKKTQEMIDEMLKTVDMFDKKKRKLGELSGGELQRLVLCQAINPVPNLLLLDEPLTAIDAIGEEYFVKLIRKLKDSGTTIIWVNHNLKQVKGIADKVSCIKCGVEFSGNPEHELKHDRILDIFS